MEFSHFKTQEKMLMHIVKLKQPEDSLYIYLKDGNLSMIRNMDKNNVGDYEIDK